MYLDGENTFLFVHADLDSETLPITLLGSQETLLLERIGGIREKFPNEYILIGVEGFSHDIQQLLGLCLELILLRGLCKTVSRHKVGRSTPIESLLCDTKQLTTE